MNITESHKISGKQDSKHMISISLISLRLDKVERGMWNVHIVEHLYSAIKKEEFHIHVLLLKLETIK